MKSPFRISASAAALLALSACGAAVTPPPKVAPPPSRPQPMPTAGVPEDVLGKDARALGLLFGQPRLDVREGTGRKLQFLNERCVLDTYLYARRAGSEAVVTHAEARDRAGGDMATAACIAQLRAK